MPLNTAQLSRPLLCVHPVAESWSERWLAGCTERNIPVIKLDLFAPDAIARVGESGVQAVLFDLPWLSGQSIEAARNLVRTLELMGLDVFPNDASYWHYDNKLAQYFLFKSLGIPSSPTSIFYKAAEALSWAEQTTYPKVWKLKSGAGSSNVRLVHSLQVAQGLIRRAFGRGFSPVPKLLDDFNTKIYKHSQHRDWWQTLRRLPQTLRSILEQRRAAAPERGYAIFQDFLPGNGHDTRVTVIGKRAFAYRRFTRPKDFRASGSGRMDWEPGAIDPDCVRLAFQAAGKIGSRCLAFDIIYDLERKPVVLEISYRFIAEFVQRCPGYWDERLTFHEGHIWPQDAILDDLLERLQPAIARVG